MSETEDLGHRLLTAVGRLNRWASHHAAYDVPLAQLRLLVLIDVLEPTRVGELAAVDHTSQPSVSAQLNRTEAAGWTRRTPDPEDARAQVVTLTADGRAALEGARQARAQALAPVLAELTGEEREQLARASEALGSLLTRLEPRSGRPLPPSTTGDPV